MIVVIMPEAEQDFERIGDYIAQDSPARAESFVDELVARCERLAQMPLRYPLLPGHESSGIRRMAHRNYLIFYTVLDDRIHILHIFSGVQDYEKLLFPPREEN